MKLWMPNLKKLPYKIQDLSAILEEVLDVEERKSLRQIHPHLHLAVIPK